MKIYICPKCKSKYLEWDLVRTRCSENGVEPYVFKYCPRCIHKRRPELIELEEVSE